jgi:NAD(P)-dependent dehydrogenase (short-subunit alcohol dehydrogenase family)
MIKGNFHGFIGGKTMQDKLVALIRGANKGKRIGLQIAKDLAAKGFTVLVGPRECGVSGRAACGVRD